MGSTLIITIPTKNSLSRDISNSVEDKFDLSKASRKREDFEQRKRWLVLS